MDARDNAIHAAQLAVCTCGKATHAADSDVYTYVKAVIAATSAKITHDKTMPVVESDINANQALLYLFQKYDFQNI